VRHQAPTGSVPAIWNELSPWHSIEISAELPTATHVRLPPSRLAKQPETVTRSQTSHGRHIGTPVRLCSHAIAGRRCRRVHGFAASQLGSNLSPHPSTLAAVRTCSGTPTFAGAPPCTQHSQNLNQHQHDWATWRRTFSRPLRPALRVEKPRVTSREHRRHVTFFYLVLELPAVHRAFSSSTRTACATPWLEIAFNCQPMRLPCAT